jgi:cytochrome-b5 reductase
MTTFPTSMKDLLEHPEMIAVLAITAAAIVLSSVYLVQLVSGGGSKPKKVFPLEDFQDFKLIRKEVLSHDTRAFTFALPADHVLGLPTGQHVSLKYTDAATGKAVQRSYTPVTDDRTVGSFQLVIKVYKPSLPRFPEGGKMSQHLDSLAIGDTILAKGPKGHLHYHSPGKFSVKPLGKPKQERSVEQIGMMAGGTGITPMLQILQKILTNPRDSKTKVNLIYANNTVSDILVRQELEAWQRQFPDRFHIWYTVGEIQNAEEKDEWQYDTGFINPDMVQQHLLFDDMKSKATQFFMCGPPPMIKFACVPALEAAGFTEQEWVIL